MFNPSRSDGDVADWLVEVNEGSGIDVMLEMSGAPSAIDATFRGVHNGGRVTLFGIPSSPVRIDVAESMIFKNLTVLALNGRRIFDTWYRTRWLLENGVVDLRPLITRELDLEDIDEAMRLLEAGAACKIILRPRVGGEVSRSLEGERRAPDASIRGQDLHR